MENATLPPESNPRPRLLVADDSPEMRRLIGEIAVGAGWEVAGEAADGAAAVACYRELRPDAVTLDLTLETADGLDVLRTIRTGDPQARVVVVSGLEAPPRQQEARRLGAAEIVLKPFPAEQLQAALRSCLSWPACH